MTPELEYLRRLIEEAEPGPWNADSDPQIGAVVEDARGHILVGFHPDGRPDLETARLIAALRNIAPALFELLRCCELDGTAMRITYRATLAVLAAIREQMPKEGQA